MTTGQLRVLVTGSRTINSEGAALVRNKLAQVCGPVLGRGNTVIIVQGECPYGGVDRIARDWAEQTDRVVSEGHPADWSKQGAGPARNARMVALGADLCIAFPDIHSRGTWDCLRKAAVAGIPGRVYPLGGPR